MYRVLDSSVPLPLICVLRVLVQQQTGLVIEKLEFTRNLHVQIKKSVYNKCKEIGQLCKQKLTNLFIYYKKYIESTQNNLSTDLKQFWSYIHSKRGHTLIPAKIYFQDNVIW